MTKIKKKIALINRRIYFVQMSNSFEKRVNYISAKQLIILLPSKSNKLVFNGFTKLFIDTHCMIIYSSTNKRMNKKIARHTIRTNIIVYFSNVIILYLHII